MITQDPLPYTLCICFKSKIGFIFFLIGSQHSFSRLIKSCMPLRKSLKSTSGSSTPSILPAPKSKKQNSRNSAFVKGRSSRRSKSLYESLRYEVSISYKVIKLYGRNDNLLTYEGCPSLSSCEWARNRSAMDYVHELLQLHR